MKTVSENRAFGGVQGVYSHTSAACACDMTFAVYMPPQAKDGPVPLLWYLSGLTCTHQNVMDKGEYRRFAAEHGIANTPLLGASVAYYAAKHGQSGMNDGLRQELKGRPVRV